MEIFKIEKSEDFDVEVWMEKLEVKPNDIVLVKANKPLEDSMIQQVVDNFIDLVSHEERFQDVRMFILPDPDINLSLLTDTQLEEMGLIRIPPSRKKKK